MQPRQREQEKRNDEDVVKAQASVGEIKIHPGFALNAPSATDTVPPPPIHQSKGLRLLKSWDVRQLW